MTREKKLTFRGKNSKEFTEAIDRSIKFITRKNYRNGWVFGFISVESADGTDKTKSDGGYFSDGKDNIVKLFKESYKLFDDNDERFYISVLIRC